LSSKFTEPADHVSDTEPEDYCRQLERYLCRKNEGHLIRIVGPAFERVSDWSRQGIPLTVACQGIDRYFERYYRRGPRRRPVRIEFCEADVLDAFDAWRKAVGVPRDEDAGATARRSLASHIDRVVARLTTLRAGGGRLAAVDALLERIARELDAVQARARTARGQARAELIERLASLDRELVHEVKGAAPAEVLDAALAAADEQLLPFRDRMSADAFTRTREHAADRYVRDHFSLPTVAFE
jgi:hypothetical protein